MKRRFISFLSDFGLTDDFVGTCHGVMKRIAPDVGIIDITHGIAPQAVLPGALILRNTLRYLPSESTSPSSIRESAGRGDR